MIQMTQIHLKYISGPYLVTAKWCNGVITILTYDSDKKVAL